MCMCMCSLGTFSVHDFRLNARGGDFRLSEPAAAEGAGAAGAASAGAASGGVEIESVADIETLDELGHGASGAVCRAQHRGGKDSAPQGQRL